MVHYFFQILLIMIMAWTSAVYAFAVETFLKTVESVIATQRDFCAHFFYVRVMLFQIEKKRF